MKKLLILLACFPIALLFTGCPHGKSDQGGGTITNVHAPMSPTDSIKFTADTSHLHLYIFSPFSGTNHVVVHDVSTNSDVFSGDVSTSIQNISGLVSGDTYTVMCWSGSGTSTNFSHVSSSFRNSGQTPSPFAGYTQYYNSSGMQGPGDGVVVIIMEGE